MCYCPTPTLHLNLALTRDGAFQLSPQKTHSVWFISVLNYGDTENFLINHLLLVIPMSYPCHYTNLCPHKPHKHAHTHTHTHTQSLLLIEARFIWLKTVILWNIITIQNTCFLFQIYIVKLHLFLWSKLNFQHHYPSLQCQMIFSNYSNMLICCSKIISDY